MHDVTAEAIKKPAKIVERTRNVEITDVYMPMLMGCKWLNETGSFL